MSTSLVATLELGLHLHFGVLARAPQGQETALGLQGDSVLPRCHGEAHACSWSIVGKTQDEQLWGLHCRCFASWALSSTRQNGLQASSGPPAFPGELLALSITSIHLPNVYLLSARKK